jgi:hypothetical protein
MNNAKNTTANRTAAFKVTDPSGEAGAYFVSTKGSATVLVLDYCIDLPNGYGTTTVAEAREAWKGAAMRETLSEAEARDLSDAIGEALAAQAEGDAMAAEACRGADRGC